MKRIFYGLAGDGLGHASRTLAILEAIPEDYEVHLFTFGQALKFFQDRGYPHLHEIEGTMWANKPGGISMWKTLWKNKGLLMSGFKKNIGLIHRMGIDLRPDLYISDFEPSVARTAHRAKIPLLSVDNQHRFSHCHRRGLPLGLQWHCTIMGAATCWLVPKPDKVVICTFHSEFLKPCADNVILTDALLRKDIVDRKVENANFVLVYARHGFSEPIFKSLMNCDDHQFRIYGATEGAIQQMLAKRDNFEFFPIGPQFAEDLARCSKVIAPSGHQLLSETCYYGKDILTIPQAGQKEQSVNAFYVDKMGCGKWCELKKLNYEVVEDFLKRDFEPSRFARNGVDKVIEVIESYF